MKIFALCLICLIFLFSNSTICKHWNWERVFYQYDTLNHLNYSFMGISKADSMNIMAVNAPDYNLRQIVKSTDGGRNWKLVYEDSVDSNYWPYVHHIAYDISYPTKDFCIITCDSNFYLKTTDGGATWKENKANIQYVENFGILNVNMYNEKIGIINSMYDIIISDDGFETYKKINLPGLHDILNVVKYSATGIYCMSLYPNKIKNAFFQFCNICFSPRYFA